MIASFFKVLWNSALINSNSLVYNSHVSFSCVQWVSWRFLFSLTLFALFTLLLGLLHMVYFDLELREFGLFPLFLLPLLALLALLWTILGRYTLSFDFDLRIGFLLLFVIIFREFDLLPLICLNFDTRYYFVLNYFFNAYLILTIVLFIIIFILFIFFIVLFVLESLRSLLWARSAWTSKVTKLRSLLWFSTFLGLFDDLFLFFKAKRTDRRDIKAECISFDASVASAPDTPDGRSVIADFWLLLLAIILDWLFD